MLKIGWLDSARQNSRIHLTVDGKQTTCGILVEPVYIVQIVPSKRHGRSNYCRACFADKVKSKFKWYESEENHERNFRRG